jgi:hypothetical protein
VGCPLGALLNNDADGDVLQAHSSGKTRNRLPQRNLAAKHSSGAIAIGVRDQAAFAIAAAHFADVKAKPQPECLAHRAQSRA